MHKTKSLYAIAMALALPLSIQVAGMAGAAELDPPPPPAAPADLPLDACFPLLIESGSDQDFVDADGQTWSADVGYLGGSTADRGEIEIAATADDRIYQTERWGTDGYVIQVPNGAYTVSLHFAETFHDAAGKRIFSVDVEGQTVNDLDVFAEAGDRNTALVKTFENVVVADGELNIALGEGAIINGIAVDAVPPVLALEGATVAENAPAGTLAGTVTASAAGDAVVSFALIDSADGRFVIDADSGDVSVAADAVLDFETAASHDIVVEATDDRGARAEATFTIAITDVLEAKTELHLAALLPENAPAGSSVGVIAATLNEGSPDVGFVLSDDAGGRFSIDAASGTIRVAEGAELDYESASSHNITAVASDGAERSFVVALDDVNEPVTDVRLSAQAVEANAPAGTVIGIASAVDPDTAETFTFSLLNDAETRFAIDATSGVVSVAADANLDPEAAASHRIVIQATDSAGHAHREGFTIAVEAPVAVPQPILIETGSDAEHVAADGRLWQADEGFVGGQIVDRGAMQIAGTDDDRIYQTERWGLSAYQLPVATGLYTVKLHFAETNERSAEVGKRVFSVDVEGRAIDNIDIFAEAGSATALVKTVDNVFVQDGQLDIAFAKVAGEPVINAIEIEPVLICTASGR